MSVMLTPSHQCTGAVELLSDRQTGGPLKDRIGPGSLGVGVWGKGPMERSGTPRIYGMHTKLTSVRIEVEAVILAQRHRCHDK